MFEQILETGSSRPLKGRSLGGGGCIYIYILYMCVDGRAGTWYNPCIINSSIRCLDGKPGVPLYGSPRFRYTQSVSRGLRQSFGLRTCGSNRSKSVWGRCMFFSLVDSGVVLCKIKLQAPKGIHHILLTRTFCKVNECLLAASNARRRESSYASPSSLALPPSCPYKFISLHP